MNNDRPKTLFKKIFDAIGKDYDHPALFFFIESAKDIATYINYRGDEKVLDVATGTGHVALSLSEYLPRGEIIGIDLSSQMLAQAKAKKESLDINNVRFLEMDMQAIHFPANHFDIAICALSIFFVQDIVGLICHISDKVKPGGKIIVSTFHENTFMPLGELCVHRLKQYGLKIPPPPGKNVDTEEKCSSLFKKAGLENILVETRNLGRYLKDCDEWWDLLWNSAFRLFLTQLPPQVLEKYKKEHLKEIKEYTTEDRIWLELQVIYTMGTKI